MATGAPYPRLVGDIGGTHARFGWVQDAGSGITEVDAFLCDDQAGLDAAVSRYLSAHGAGGAPVRARSASPRRSAATSSR